MTASFREVILAMSIVSAGAGPSPGDRVVLNDTANSIRSGQVLAIDRQFVRLRTSLGRGAIAVVQIPRNDVRRVEFGFDGILGDAALRKLDQNRGVQALWTAWQHAVDLVGVPAAVVGLAYGELLLNSGDVVKIRRALDLFQDLERRAWNPEDRVKAREGRLAAMIALGEEDDALDEARSLVSGPEEATVETKLLLAYASHMALVKLVEDHPRWMEDDVVRPKHERLFEDALHFNLSAYLHHASNEKAAAAGLWGAVRVYELIGDDFNAAECARDLIAIYPGSAHESVANALLESLDNENDANPNDQM